MLATGSRSFSVIMALFVGLSLLAGLLHAADDFVRGEVSRPRTFALLVVAASTLYFFGLIWSWQGRAYGHVIVLVLSALFFFATFLSHVVAPAGGYSILRIARTAGPFFAFVSLAGGVSSLVAAILAGHALARDKPL